MRLTAHHKANKSRLSLLHQHLTSHNNRSSTNFCPAIFLNYSSCVWPAPEAMTENPAPANGNPVAKHLDMQGLPYVVPANPASRRQQPLSAWQLYSDGKNLKPFLGWRSGWWRESEDLLEDYEQGFPRLRIHPKMSFKIQPTRRFLRSFCVCVPSILWRFGFWQGRAVSSGIIRHLRGARSLDLSRMGDHELGMDRTMVCYCTEGSDSKRWDFVVEFV